MNETKHADALFSQTVVEALYGLEWLTNLQRLDIADALWGVFVAEPGNPDLAAATRDALGNAAQVVRDVDVQYSRTGLSELSRERMALARAIRGIEDLKQQNDAAKRSAGVLGWRKKEAVNTSTQS